MYSFNTSDDYSLSCERSLQNFKTFEEDLGVAVNVLGRLINTHGRLKEFQDIYVYLNKLHYSNLQLREEYMSVLFQAIEDQDIKGLLEKMDEENTTTMTEINERLEKFR